MQEIELLQEKLRELAQANLDHERAKAEVEVAENKLHALPEYQELGEVSEKAQGVRDTIAALRTEINDLTLNTYKATGEKKPAEGVGVRVGTVYLYDPDQAKSYCLGELPEALKLDSRTFEKYVKGVQEVKPLDFVTTEEKITPTIASDLSDYLELELSADQPIS